MQYRSPVGFGPSSKTWPRCPSHRAHETLVRVIPRLLSVSSMTFSFLIGAQKLGQPVPESNFCAELNTGNSHPAHMKVPLSCMSFSGLEKAYSVPSCRSTSYCSGVNWAFHSASLLDTFLIPLDLVPPPLGRGLGGGLTANPSFNIFSLGCAKLGSRDK